MILISQRGGKLRQDSTQIQRPLHKATPIKARSPMKRGNSLLPCPVPIEILTFPTSPSPTTTHHRKLYLGKLLLGAQPLDKINPSPWWSLTMSLVTCQHAHRDAPTDPFPPQSISGESSSAGNPSGKPGQAQVTSSTSNGGFARCLEHWFRAIPNKNNEARKGVLLLGNNTS